LMGRRASHARVAPPRGRGSAGMILLRWCLSDTCQIWPRKRLCPSLGPRQLRVWRGIPLVGRDLWDSACTWPSSRRSLG
jgi:hypothetical protein